MSESDASESPPEPSPWFFPSVSSVKTNYAVLEYVRLLNAMGARRYLVSAYDLARASAGERAGLEAELQIARSRGCNVLIDCGNYESYWKGDQSWDRETFHAVARSTEWSVAFSFDNQRPGDSLEAVVSEVVTGTLKDRDALAGRQVCPIVHAPPEILPEACAAIAQKLTPEMIAVPERELGDGIYARAVMVWRISRMLSSLTPSPLLHLLGTGNPISLLLFVAAGANSFDGLEWCQTCVDRTDGRLHHFQHYDFFAYQTAGGENSGLSYGSAVLSHNLAFFDAWMRQISIALEQRETRAMLERYLPSGALQDLENHRPEGFSWR